MRMVDVLWAGQTVAMFAEDVQKRGEEIPTNQRPRVPHTKLADHTPALEVLALTPKSPSGNRHQDHRNDQNLDSLSG
jgi:hypothetical protein